MRRRPLLLALTALAALAACGDLFDFTTSATDGAGESESDPSTTGAPQMCGEAPEGPACVPAGSSTLGALCAARASPSECLAFGDGVASKCAWVDVTTHPAGASTCAGGSGRGVCVGLQASGAACNDSTCAGSVATTTHYRFTASCEVEVFQGSFCGFEVVDWSVCQWSGGGTDTCTVPWPSAGPPACKCAC